MAKDDFTEGDFRRFILANRSRLRFPGSRGEVWHPIAENLQVKNRSWKHRRPLDLLFLSESGRFLVAEIKKRDSPDRGRKPIDQAMGYAEGLRRIRDIKSLKRQLARKWTKRAIYHWIQTGKHGPLSDDFEKAMGHLFGSDFKRLLKRAFKKLKKRAPHLLVIQEGEVNRETRAAIKKAKNVRVRGIALDFPAHEADLWKRKR